MRRNSPVPRGTRSSARAWSAAVGMAAVLALSACGSAGGSTPEAGSAAPSTTASATATPSATATTPASPSPSGTTASPEATAAASGVQNTQPEPERTASAPELGMPPAVPFTPPARDGQGVCNPSRLSGAVANEQGAAGSVIASLTLTNTGGSPCVLDGYPGVSFVGADGEIIGMPAGRDASGAGSAITLQPGASASAALKITQAGVIGTCNPHDATGLRVYPPGSYESLVIPYSARACGNPKVEQLQVKAFGS